MEFAFFIQILLFWLCAAQIVRGGVCVEEQDGGALVVALKHRGFGGIKFKNSFELVEVSRNRSSIRFHTLKSRRPHHHRHGRRHHSLDVSLPLRAASDYIMSLMLGTPPQRLEVFMDTGSDLVWVPCSSNSSNKGSFDCIMCEGSDIPTFFEFDSHSNRHESCGTGACSAIHSTDNLNDLCIMAGCPFDTLDMEPCQNPCPPFYYAYGDGSLMGELIRDRLTVHLSKGGTREISNFTFGCARMSLGEAVGVAGFGRGVLPFPAQLSDMGSRGFSYCLVSHKFDDNLHVSSPLLFGDIAIPKQGKVQYTPMINNSIYHSFYYLGLEGISIGGHWLKLPSSLTQIDSEGNGGLIIDSGTTFTMLPESLHRKVKNRLKAAIQYNRSVDFEEATGLDLCYNFPTAKGTPILPTFKFHFKDNATITLPAENYMFTIPDSDDDTASTNITSTSVGCLIILSSGDEVYGPAAVLGNYQQQNLNVVFDIEKQRIGFLPKLCSGIAH